MADKFMVKKPYPLGAHIEDDKIRFSFVSMNKDCGILLFDKSGNQLKRIPFTQEEKTGNIYCKYITGVKPDAISYMFYEGERKIMDERARVFRREATYGKACSQEDYKAGFVTDEFDWQNDSNPRVPYKDALVYCLHVRGFTKASSSGVREKGTFAGLMEKLPYLKEIGVTTVELQPAYEFAEVAAWEERREEIIGNAGLNEPEGMDGANKINYWGYRKGFYYTPKAAYAASKQPVEEFKKMVRAFHANHMEVVMQFYFPKEVPAMEIAEILRFWVLEYHVDGFHLMGEGFFAESLAADPALADTKLWYYQFDTKQLYRKKEMPIYRNLAEYNDNWYLDMRKFLKGDENMLSAVLYHMRHIPEKCGCIHYLSNYYGFTLNDMVSYDHKHNEENGEDNRDGTDYNCSWNCGEEGPSRKGRIKQLRTKQLKNAIMLLLLSQSTPLIFMGDEFGNTQNGNNNPYCQDNETTWLNWKLINKNRELFDFWKTMLAFRRMYSVLTPEAELQMQEYISCGYPDLSYHGENAWRVQVEGHLRHTGIMLCGTYADADRATEEVCIYIAMNMHWEAHDLALPKPPKGQTWRKVISTEASQLAEENPKEPNPKEPNPKEPNPKEPKAVADGSSTMEKEKDEKKGSNVACLMAEIPARSILVYVTEENTSRSCTKTAQK